MRKIKQASGKAVASGQLQTGGSPDGKFFATITERLASGAANQCPDFLRYLPETDIAARMAIDVVDVLEVIDIEHPQADGRLGMHSPLPFHFQQFIETGAIPASGQRIGPAESLHFFTGDGEILKRIVEFLHSLAKPHFKRLGGFQVPSQQYRNTFSQLLVLS